MISAKNFGTANMERTAPLKIVRYVIRLSDKLAPTANTATTQLTVSKCKQDSFKVKKYYRKRQGTALSNIRGVLLGKYSKQISIKWLLPQTGPRFAHILYRFRFWHVLLFVVFLKEYCQPRAKKATLMCDLNAHHINLVHT